MDNLLIDLVNDSVRNQINHKVNALANTCEKSSSIACFGHDKDTLLKNLKALCDALRLRYNTLGYVFNNNAFYLARKFYITRLSERVGSLTSHTAPLNNTSPLFDVVRYVICHNPGHSPELIISHYRSDSTNYTQWNTYLQPDETVIIPLTLGDSHRIENRSPNLSQYNRYGLSVNYLNSIKLDLVAKWRFKHGDESIAFNAEEVFVSKPTESQPPSTFTRKARNGARQQNNDHRDDEMKIQDNISHESTIVGALFGEHQRNIKRRI